MLVLAARVATAACVGDCNGNGRVEISELITGVNIALGAASRDACPGFDANLDTSIGIDELVAAVASALDACQAPPAGASVLQHHREPTRAGVYVIPELTKAHAAALAIDPTFAPTATGATYAQPLYLASPDGPDVVFVATERNEVSAFDASNGATLWQRTLAAPMPRSKLPCGNIDPLGITGTPIIDEASRTIFLDAMTDAGGGTAKHMVYSLSIDDGSTRPGWPVDVDARVSFDGVQFTSRFQNQRGALGLLDGRIYVVYGGHFGDCGTYYGWVVGIAIDDPTSIGVYRTHDDGAAIWAPAGISSDGTDLYVSTGNGFGGPEWGQSEALLRLAPGPVFDASQTKNYFVPPNWPQLDKGDVDLAGTAPVLVDMPGTAHPHLAIALGKDGKMYVADRTDLGGIGGGLLTMQVASGSIINAAAAYHTPNGTYVVFKGRGARCPNGTSGTLTAVRLLPTDPITAETAWCADPGGLGSPMVTQTQLNGSDTIVWVTGSEGDEKLHGFDGDSGAVVFAGGGDAETMSAGVRRYVTPIAAKGRIFVGGDGRVYAFH